MEELFGFVGVLCFIAFVVAPLFILFRNTSRTRELEQRIGVMQMQIQALQKQVLSLLPSEAAQTPAKPSAAMPQAEFDLALLKEIAKPQQPAPTTPEAAEIPPPLRSPITPPKPPSRTNAEWEAFVGGKLLNRIGAVAIIFGIGFFLQYAFDANLIPEWLRPLIGVALGMGMLVAAHRLKTRGFEIVAQGLVGAGVSALYLSVFAAFDFYHLIPQPVAFVLMISVTVVGFLQALRYDSRAIALLSWAGGFLTPLFLSTGDVNAVGLFSYLAFLDVGLLALVFMKDEWFALKPLSFAATWLYAAFWYMGSYNNGNYFTIAIFFSTLYWALFFAVDFYRSYSGMSSKDARWRNLESGINSPLYYAALYAVVNPYYHAVMPMITLLYGSVYTVAFLLLRAKQPQNVFTSVRYVLTAIVALVGATAIYFDNSATVIGWAVEAVVLLWIGVRWNLSAVRYAALGLLILTILRLLALDDSYSAEHFRLFWNMRVLTWSVVITALLLCALAYNRAEERFKSLIITTLHSAWSALLFVLLTLETVLYYQAQSPEVMVHVLQFRTMQTLVIVWLMYAIFMVWVGLRAVLMPLLYCGLVAALVSAVVGVTGGFAYIPATDFMPILNIRSMALLSCLAAFAGIRTIVQRQQSFIAIWLDYVVQGCGIAMIVVAFTLLTGETSDVFQQKISFLHASGWSAQMMIALEGLENMRKLLLSLLWLLYSIALLAFGIARRVRGLRLAAILLFGISILKVFLFDLSFLQTPYRILSFIALGGILLFVSYLYQRYKDVILGAQSS